MKQTFLFFVALAASLSLYAQKPRTITEIITYKVNLSLDPDLDSVQFTDPYFVYGQLNDQWYQNKLQPAQFQLLVKDIHQAAAQGKITVYDPYFELEGSRPVFHKLPVSEVASMGNDTIYRTLQRPYPPYDDFDTVIVNTFNVPQSIVQIEFMEKWTLNPKTMEIKKEVIAYALWRKRMDLQTGEFRGLSRMYWVKRKK